MATLPEGLKERARARVGRQLGGRWRLERLLGVGGVAAVYAAHHRNGRKAAVKVLHPELALDDSIRRRFLREGYVANRVEHPGVVVVLDDAADEDGTVFLVMELLNGETLEARCRRFEGRLEQEPALVVAARVLDVLGAAHAKGILHRDITPANVFVTSEGGVKLLDFGIARLRDTSGEPLTMSAPGTLGTPGFMAPEQARGLWEEVDERTDLWSLAATLFRAVAGRPVHEGRTASEQLLYAMTRPAPSLRSVAADLSIALERFLGKALAFEKSERFASAKVMLGALEDVYESVAGHAISEASPLTGTDEATGEGVATDAPSQSRAVATGVSTTSVAERESASSSSRRPALRLAWLGSGATVIAGATALVLYALKPGADPESAAPISASPAPSQTAIPEPSATAATLETPAARAALPVPAPLASSLPRRVARAAPAVKRPARTAPAEPPVTGSAHKPAANPADLIFDRRE